jgi:PAS domain S-box-containing protein
LTALTRCHEPLLAPSSALALAAGFSTASVDGPVANVAVLDGAGVIVAVNDGWAQFAIANGGGALLSRPGNGVGIGSDYLLACAAASASEPLAAEVQRALVDILAGRRDSFQAEYPCHAPGQAPCWFGMRILPLAAGGAVIVHEDVTARRSLAALRVAPGGPLAGAGTFAPGLGDGGPEGSARLLADVAERFSIEQELRGTRDFLDTVAQAMPDGLYVLDDQGRLVFINAAAERMFGWTRAELVGQVMHEVVHSQREDGSPLALEDCPITLARANARAVSVDSDVFIRRDGTHLPVSYSASPCELPGGGVGWVVVFNDITERREREAHLRREREARDWVTAIRTALDERLFVLDAQPIVDLASGATVAHELLIRMLAADGTVIAPAAFLPTAERFGLIREIDRYVIERALRYAAAGHQLEVNVSAASLSDPNLTDFVRRGLLEHAVDPRRLGFEITETALLENETAAVRFATDISALGCGVALDDFGTGYGSFHYLKRLPAQILKIDREFVADLDGDPANRHVVDAIVRLAQALGKRTVAEGVEDARTLAILRELNVDCGQGYLFARPARADEILPLRSPDEGH